MKSANQFWILKILTVLGFFLVIVFHISVHTDDSKSIETTDLSEWDQPEALSALYSNPISNRRTHFNYAGIEKILWQISNANSEKLLINKGTAERLELACSYIAQEATPEDHKRLAFLIKKSVSGEQGVQLSDLLRNYCQYLIAEKNLQENLAKVTGDEQLVLLEVFPDQIEALQIELFGERNTQALFSRKNVTMRYFNQRRIINLSDLSSQQKKAELDRLQEQYKKTIDGQLE